MPLWVQACPDATAPVSACVEPLVWVDVTASQPFVLTEAHFANMGEAFAAGLLIVVMFWGLGFGAGLILNAIRRH
jgi:hypothetical protein